MKDYGNMFELVEQGGNHFLRGRISGNWILIDAERMISTFKDPSNFHYYVYTYHGSPRFIFVTRVDMNVNILETYGMYGGSFSVTGALYDNHTFKFVSYKGKTSFEFIIHDAGIPHVICDRASGEYVILYYSCPCDKFIRFETGVSNIQSFVTHIRINEFEKEVERFRVIFYKEHEKNKMFIISNDLDKDMISTDVTLKECFDGVCRSKVDDWYLSFYRFMISPTASLVDATFKKSTKYLVYEVPITSYVISGDGGIIVEDPISKYGNMTLIVPGDDLIFYGDNSFFEYELLTRADMNGCRHNIVKVTWRRNDFDNSTSYYDILNRKEVLSI